MTPNEAYEALCTRVGFPGSNRLRVVLEDLLTPDQARMVAALPASPADVAALTGFPEQGVAEELNRLAYQGVVRPKGGLGRQEYFYFVRGIVELLDGTLGTMKRDITRDRPLFEHWHDFCINEMYPALGKHWARVERPTTRIVPAYGAIKDLANVPPYENFRELMKAQSSFAVIPCPCRQRRAAVGEVCDYVEEAGGWHCMSFGSMADSVIERGAGTKLSLDEVLELVDRVEKEGLLHTWVNSPAMTSEISCQCCRDCCVAVAPLDAVGASLAKMWAKSSFEAFVDPERCDGCQDCVVRCQFEAITMVMPASSANGARKSSKKLKAQIDPENCWGCGLCVIACDEADAIGFKQVRSMEAVPV